MTTPALSSTLARLLITQSPLHCWYNSRDLNPDYAPEFKDEFDLGTAVHRMLLEPDRVDTSHVVVQAKDWRTKAAQDARHAARIDGKTPLLAHQAVELAQMVAAVRATLSRFEERPTPLTNGVAEKVLEWREGDVLCRTRLDWLHFGELTVDDVKTSGNANPDVFRSQVWSLGYDMQAAFYLRGVRAIYGKDAVFRFVVCETRAPYGVSVVGLDPEALALADRRVERAIRLWRECLASGNWPSYPERTAYLSAPPWEIAREQAQAYMEAEPRVIDDGRPLADQLWGDR